MRKIERLYFFGVVSAFVTSTICSGVNAGCQPIPISVAEYVQKNPDWAPLTAQDLAHDDQELWAKYHKGRCPGIAEVNLYDPRTKSYAVALIKKVGKKLSEKLVIVGDAKSSSSAEEIVKQEYVIDPYVVWKAAPGYFVDENTGKKIHVEQESIVYEKMESGATQFFIKHGKLLSLLASD